MAELAERVARLEERFDGVTAVIADLKEAVSKLDAHMQTGFAEMRAEMRTEMRTEFGAVRSESAGIRAEMHTQFRWIMGGIGSATLVILFAVLAAILA